MPIRKLTLPVEVPQIEINGIVFDLKMSDLEIYDKAQKLFGKYQTKYGQKSVTDFPIDEVIADAKEAERFMNDMLGKGAAFKISGGNPVGFSELLQWISVISTDAAAHYQELVVHE